MLRTAILRLPLPLRQLEHKQDALLLQKKASSIRICLGASPRDWNLDPKRTQTRMHGAFSAIAERLVHSILLVNTHKVAKQVNIR